MSEKEELRGAPAAIGMVILALLFCGVVFAIYPGWTEFWSAIKNGGTAFFSAIAGLGAAVSAFFSWRTLVQSKEIKQDDELLAHAVITLERAYEALMVGSENNKPKKHRLNWLTSARMIVDYQDTKSQLKSSEIIRRCEGHENYWRMKFYDSLNLILPNSNYYFSPRGGDSNAIEPVSALVIHKFADWPEGKADNLSRYGKRADAIKEIGVSMRWIELRRHLDLL